MNQPSAEAEIRSGLTELLPRLVRYARVLTPSSSDADDLLQITCEKALTKWQQFQPGTKLDAWTFRIMSSTWKNELRSRAIRQGKGFVDVESLESRIGSHHQGNIFFRQVLERIMNLPENQRETVLLAYVEGYSYQQTAEILDIAEGTVMSRLARARQALASNLEAPDAIDKRGKSLQSSGTQSQKQDKLK